jgi:hypothetical protein
MRREKTQISRIRNAKGEITTNTMEVQEIIRDYFENLYSNKFENYNEMDRFLDKYDHPKLNQEEINHLYRCITQNEIEAAINCLSIYLSIIYMSTFFPFRVLLIFYTSRWQSSWRLASGIKSGLVSKVGARDLEI